MEIITVEASLVNPTDSTEVNVVAAVATVGKTHRLATGQIIKWTAEFLRANAHTFVGKPVNIKLDPRTKEATAHSRNAIGAIKEAYFDEDKQAVIVTAALWEHYSPETISKIRELYAAKKLHVSMEFKYPKDTLVANADGSHTPTVGTFSGMGFVGQAGDPRSMVYLMAALEADEDNARETSVNEVIKEVVARLTGTYHEPTTTDEADKVKDDANAELSAAHEGSYEWLRRGLQEHLAAGGSPDQPVYCYVIATYPNYAIYQEGEDYFRIDYKRAGDKLNFGEPQEVDPVYQPTAKASAAEGGDDPAENTGNQSLGENQTMSEKTPEEALAAKDEQIAEMKTSLDAALSTLNELKASQDARDAADKAQALATERMAELEKILPVKDELKASLFENLKSLDPAAYEVVKATFASSVELKAGIADGERIENPDPTPDKNPQSVPEAILKNLQAEAAAQFGTGAKSPEDKE